MKPIKKSCDQINKYIGSYSPIYLFTNLILLHTHVIICDLNNHKHAIICEVIYVMFWCNQ
jgi:hypothetical protein